MKERCKYMDIFRAFGIILMVMGHINFGKLFDHFIHAFHMPMFFFVSGFFFKKSDLSFFAFVKKKAKSLLIPYVFIGISAYLSYIVFNGFSLKPLMYIFCFNTVNVPNAGAIWFLTALFLTDIIYFFLSRKGLRILIIPLVLIGSFADTLLPLPLPFALSASFVGLGLYFFGELCAMHREKFSKAISKGLRVSLPLAVLCTVLIFLNGGINMRQGVYSFIPLFWVNTLLAIFVGISLSKILDKALTHTPPRLQNIFVR